MKPSFAKVPAEVSVMQVRRACKKGIALPIFTKKHSTIQKLSSLTAEFLLPLTAHGHSGKNKQIWTNSEI